MGRKHRRKVRTQDPPSPTTLPVPVSGRWRFFVWSCAFFFLAALVMRLDVITVWPGAEGFALLHAMDSSWGGFLPAALNHALLPLGEAIDTRTDAIFLFPRLVSAASMLLTGFFTYRWGGRLFGKKVAELSVLCAGASLFLPFFGKVASVDALALLGHSGMMWTLLLYGVAGDSKKLLPFAIFTFIGAVAAPLSTLMASIPIMALATLQSVRYDWRWPAGIALGFGVLTMIVQGVQGSNAYWFHGLEGNGLLQLVGFSLLGMAPVVGWLIAGFRDLAFKAKRFEQHALIILLSMGAALFTQSLLFTLLLAVVAGKQMQLYFDDPKYPWQNFVKSASVIHLILAFLAVFLTLAGGGLAFPGEGFRAALGMAAAYWIFSLLGTIGLFGERRDFAIGGALLAGFLGVMFFWVQVYPYIEAERGWPERLLETMDTPPTTLTLPDEREAALSVALPYFHRAGWTLTEAGEWQLNKTEADDSTGGDPAGSQVRGRVVLRRRNFEIRER